MKNLFFSLLILLTFSSCNQTYNLNYRDTHVSYYEKNTKKNFTLTEPHTFKLEGSKVEIQTSVYDYNGKIVKIGEGKFQNYNVIELTTKDNILIRLFPKYDHHVKNNVIQFVAIDHPNYSYIIFIDNIERNNK